MPNVYSPDGVTCVLSNSFGAARAGDVASKSKTNTPTLQKD
jgi:hypothetical protein